MYATIDKKRLHPSILKYINSDFIKSFKLVGNPPRYEFINSCNQKIQCAGIHSTLRKKYYPKYTRSKRKRRTNKKGSSKKQGIKVDDDIFNYLKTGKRPRHWMSRTLIDYWEKQLGHNIQASQLPVYIKDLKCASQADVITMDKWGLLHLWEVKSGFPPGGSTKKGLMMKNVPNTIYNQWQLQVFYTFKGLQPFIEVVKKRSLVINVYNEVKKNKPGVNIRHRKTIKPPAWTKNLK